MKLKLCLKIIVSPSLITNLLNLPKYQKKQRLLLFFVVEIT